MKQSISGAIWIHLQEKKHFQSNVLKYFSDNLIIDSLKVCLLIIIIKKALLSFRHYPRQLSVWRHKPFFSPTPSTFQKWSAPIPKICFEFIKKANMNHLTSDQPKISLKEGSGPNSPCRSNSVSFLFLYTNAGLVKPSAAEVQDSLYWHSFKNKEV